MPVHKRTGGDEDRTVSLYGRWYYLVWSEKSARFPPLRKFTRWLSAICVPGG